MSDQLHLFLLKMSLLNDVRSLETTTQDSRRLETEVVVVTPLMVMVVVIQLMVMVAMQL